MKLLPAICVLLLLAPAQARDGDKPDRAEMRARMLARLDKNGDGKISADERARAQAEATARQGPLPELQGNYRVQTLSFPETVTSIDSNFNPKALLFQPTVSPEGKIPLVVLLHGAGGTRQKDLARFQVNRDVKWLMTPANSGYAAKILVPQSTSHWHPEALNQAVAHLLSTHADIDASRIYCIGYSMGGLGTWTWATHTPNPLAAIVPVAFIASQDRLKAIVDLPIWAMVGTADRRRAGSIPAMEAALKDLGSTTVRTTIFKGANHAQTANLAWAQEGLLQWLFAQNREER